MKKLTQAEAGRLRKFWSKLPGKQVEASRMFNVSVETLSRTVNLKTGPIPAFRIKLKELGIVKN